MLQLFMMIMGHRMMILKMNLAQILNQKKDYILRIFLMIKRQNHLKKTKNKINNKHYIKQGNLATNHLLKMMILMMSLNQKNQKNNLNNQNKI